MKEVKIQVPEGYEIDTEKSTFENIVFKEIGNKYSKTWGEFCKNNSVKEDEAFIKSDSTISDCYEGERYSDVDANLIPYKFAKPMLALIQLLTIREKEYTKGWEPLWASDKVKYCISHIKTKSFVGEFYQTNRILSFPSKEMAETFYENWKDLIEIAKPLL